MRGTWGYTRLGEEGGGGTWGYTGLGEGDLGVYKVR